MGKIDDLLPHFFLSEVLLVDPLGVSHVADRYTLAEANSNRSVVR